MCIPYTAPVFISDMPVLPLVVLLVILLLFIGVEMVAGGGIATLRLAQPILAGFCAKLPGSDR